MVRVSRATALRVALILGISATTLSLASLALTVGGAPGAGIAAIIFAVGLALASILPVMCIPADD